MHPEEAGRALRLRAAVCLYGQTACGLSLFLLERAGTPNYLSVLAAAPFLALCRLGVRRRRREMGRTEELLLALTHHLDALSAFAALYALCHALLPDHSPWLLSLLLGSLAAFAARDRALTAASRPTAFFLLAALGFCALSALGQGNAAYLFPLLGEGERSILWGGWWACGCAAGPCLMLLEEKKPPSPRSACRDPLAFSLLLGALSAFLCALLLPGRALTRPAAVSERLTLWSRFASSAAAWPLLAAGLLLLLFYTHASALRAAGRALSKALGGAEEPGWPLWALLALPPMVLGAAADAGIGNLLLAALPLRAAAAALLLLLLQIKKRPRRTPDPNPPGKEALPHA